mmetsp:Transcript_39642/g.38197  ORF Transcript_39642/g.38197 Transcript_39642/m.38197 type:complete len:92 (+) Transcript_39642:363-638(+)
MQTHEWKAPRIDTERFQIHDDKIPKNLADEGEDNLTSQKILGRKRKKRSSSLDDALLTEDQNALSRVHLKTTHLEEDKLNECQEVFDCSRV